MIAADAILIADLGQMLKPSRAIYDNVLYQISGRFLVIELPTAIPDPDVLLALEPEELADISAQVPAPITSATHARGAPMAARSANSPPGASSVPSSTSGRRIGGFTR
jgi:hypothetical protein